MTGMMTGYMGYMIIVGIMSMIGAGVSNRLKSKFNHYSQVGIRSGMSGKDVAEAMLSHYNITDVKVVEGQGFLSDHYNPQSKTIALSPAVYNGRSISSAAVSAHECGHAVQHDTGYVWLQARSAIVPFVSFASKAQQFLLMLVLGAFGMGSGNPTIIFVAIIAFAVTALFSFITLPVEFDASRRAMVWLDETGTTTGAEYDGAKDALWWAAMTYVAAALTALVTLLFLIMKYMAATNNN